MGRLVFISQSEAALYLGVTAQAVAWMAENGKIKSYGRPRRYKFADVLRLKAQRDAISGPRPGRPSSKMLLERRLRQLEGAAV